MHDTNDREASHEEAEAITKESDQDRVLTALIDSFYPEVVQSGRLAKERAQTVLAAVTALSAVLIGALLAGDLSQEALPVRIGSIVVVFFWLLVCAGYAYAARPDALKIYPPNMALNDWLSEVMKDSRTTQAIIEDRMRRAGFLLLVALVVSFLALTMHLMIGARRHWVLGDAVFSSRFQEGAICPNGVLSVEADEASLLDDRILMRFTCSGGSRSLAIVPADDLLLFTGKER